MERKSLGEFVADVLNSVDTATYIPAGVLTGGIWFCSKVALAGGDPLEAATTSEETSFAALAFFVVTTTVVACLLAPLQQLVLRQMQGLGAYHPRRRVEHFKQQRRNLAESRLKLIKKRDGANRSPTGGPEAEDLDGAVQDRIDEESRRLLTWPQRPHRVLATRLGNIIRGYEDEADRVLAKLVDGPYGTKTIADLRPFLHGSLSDVLRSTLDRSRSQLVSTTSLATICPILGLCLVIVSTGLFWRIGFGATAITLTFAAHRAALEAAGEYGMLSLTIAQLHAAGRLDTPQADRPSRDLTASGDAAVA